MIKKFETNLHHDIPLTNDMGLEILLLENQKIQVRAPLDKNINDKGSVFGGSSSALMIITAWSLIKLLCDENNITADIVIHKNSTTWHKAMYQDLLIKAEFMQQYNFNKIKEKIAKNRHQRIDCLIKLVDADDNLFSTMTAKYVIIPKNL